MTRILLEMLESQGWFTFHPQHPTPTYGYMVGVGSSIIIENPDDVKLVISGLWGKRKLPEGMFFCGWKHEGKTYLEISKYFPNMFKAIDFGLEKNQKSVWNLQQNREVEL
jgi:hypothetical protein